MTDAKSQLALALRERLAIIADEASRQDPERHMRRLREISQRIEDLRAQLPRPLDPELSHYLQRASYEKALAFLEGRV